MNRYTQLNEKPVFSGYFQGSLLNSVLLLFITLIKNLNFFTSNRKIKGNQLILILPFENLVFSKYSSSILKIFVMNFRSLSNELQKKAQFELNEVPLIISQNIKRLRKWIKRQPHLNYRKVDDQWLLNFLRCSKFNLEQSKEKYDKFYNTRYLLPHLFTDRNPLQDEIQKVLSLGLCLPLLQTVEKDAPRIILYRCQGMDINIPFHHILKTCLMIMDILLNEDDNFIIAGHFSVIDVQNVSTNYLFQLTQDNLKDSLICLEHAYPTKGQGFYIINTSSNTEGLFNLLKPLLPRKIQNTVQVLGTDVSDSIYKSIPNNILPLEYGGTGDSLTYLTEYWKNKVEKYSDWFINESNYCNVDPKRSKLFKTLENMFCVVGSFREGNEQD